MESDQSTLTFEPPGPGPWQQDSAHVPDGFSPIVADLYPEPAMRGFEETLPATEPSSTDWRGAA